LYVAESSDNVCRPPAAEKFLRDLVIISGSTVEMFGREATPISPPLMAVLLYEYVGLD